MTLDKLCKKCKIEMEVLREEIVAGTKYKILKCKKCKHQVARTES
tara:strand:- start:12342 stop:12476 length:135 start_codon:yes stop_codon:yes gene_type:complete